MYYTCIDPLTMENIYVPKRAHEKAMQRALMQYSLPENYDLVREALKREGRTDLIGWDKKCLIRPVRPAQKPVRRGDRNQKTGRRSENKPALTPSGGRTRKGNKR